MPSAFSITLDDLPSITATHELVVPRSIPMTFPMVRYPSFCGRLDGPWRRADPKPPSDQMLAILRWYASYRRVASACKDWAVHLTKENQLLPKDRFGPVRPWARWSCVKLTR